MAQYVEGKTKIPVERKFGFGSTPLIHGALERGEIDLYIEYTGTAEQAILQLEREPDFTKAVTRLRTSYELKFNATWLSLLGFENTYVLVTCRGSGADVGKISALALSGGKLTAGMNAEFLERVDGYPAVRQTYGFRFKDTRNLDAGLIYSALDQGLVDVIVTFSTDGRLTDPRLTTLEDDRRCFPHYAAAPVVRLAALQQWPELREVLEGLGGKFTAATMQRLNHQLEIEQRPAAAVARDYWRAQAKAE